MKGLGTDIIEIERIRTGFKRFGNRFLKRIYTENEQRYCLAHKDPSPQLAVRFAAKEAVAKAIGIGFQRGITFLDIEIINNSDGKPEVILSKKLSFVKNDILISLSHCKEYALAVAFMD